MCLSKDNRESYETVLAREQSELHTETNFILIIFSFLYMIVGGGISFILYQYKIFKTDPTACVCMLFVSGYLLAIVLVLFCFSHFPRSGSKRRPPAQAEADSAETMIPL